MSQDSTRPAAPLALIFGANTTLCVKAFEGVSDAHLWLRPAPDSNPFLWIVGHVVGTRAVMLGLLGDPLETGWGQTFGRGAALDADAGTYPSKDEILRVHAEAAARIEGRFARLTADDLAREAAAGPKPFGVKTLGEQLGFFALHDSYHVGQLAYIRKALGLPGLVG